MKIIALDSSALVASAAVLENDSLVGEYTVNYKQQHSRTLLAMLDTLSGEIDLDLDTVDAIAVSAGPGSFTGLRIGSATAKGIGLALDKPIVEVPTLAAMAWNFWHSDAILCPMMDARREQVFNGLYTFEGERLVTLRDQRVLPVRDLIEELDRDVELNTGSMAGKTVILFGDGAQAFEGIFRENLKRSYAFAPGHLNRQRASSVAALGLQLYMEGRTVPSDAHAPIYLRKSQAEQDRERRLADSAPVEIHSMTFSDMEAVLTIEENAASGSDWTENSLLTYLVREDTLFLTAQREGQVLGYAAALISIDEAEILNIAVRPDARRLGIGEKLMRTLAISLKEKGVGAIHLEVRCGNAPAIGLYKKLAYQEDGIRKNYYTDPVENALLMTLKQ